MSFHNVVGTGRYITSTTNMYNKYQFHVLVVSLVLAPCKCNAAPETSNHIGKKKKDKTSVSLILVIHTCNT